MCNLCVFWSNFLYSFLFKMEAFRITRGEEIKYFRDIICHLFLGEPSTWGPRSFSNKILDLFWSTHLTYCDRFQLCLFVQNNPLPRKILMEWLQHNNMLHDRQAWNHVRSLFKIWDRGHHLEYSSWCIITKRFETLAGLACEERPQTIDRRQRRNDADRIITDD